MVSPSSPSQLSHGAALFFHIYYELSCFALEFSLPKSICLTGSTKNLCAAARQRIKARVKALVDSADEEEAHATELSALLVGVASLLLFMQAWEFPDSHVRVRPWKKP